MSGLENGSFRELLRELRGFVDADVVVTISGAKLGPPLLAELRGRLGGAQDLGSSRRFVIDVGTEARLVLDQEEISRWWTEEVAGYQVMVETGTVRVALGRAD
jgi:hypothetical protein